MLYAFLDTRRRTEIASEQRLERRQCNGCTKERAGLRRRVSQRQLWWRRSGFDGNNAQVMAGAWGRTTQTLAGEGRGRAARTGKNPKPAALHGGD